MGRSASDRGVVRAAAPDHQDRAARDDDDTSALGLRDYVAAVRAHWITVSVLTVVVGALALAVALVATPVYAATTQLYVAVQGGTTSGDLLQGANFARQQVVSYTQFVTSPLVLDPVVAELGLDESADDVADRVSASSPTNTSLIAVTVRDTDPARAAALADAIGTRLASTITELETPLGASSSTVKVSTVRGAAVPTEPVSPRVALDVALGLALGLALGIGIAILRLVLDTRVRDVEDVARVTTSAVVATIPFDADAASRPLVVQSDPLSDRAESFRRLRTNLQFLNVADRPRSVVVTSSLPGEGKSSTSINLALADAGTRVLLVDADLRRPAVARYMGLEGGVGLTTVLIGRADVQDVVQPWGDGTLDVLPAGQIPPNPSELLGSPAMTELLDKLTCDYDLVIVDAAPLLPVTDAAILAKVTGGALLVAGVQKLHRHQLADSVAALRTVDAPVLGIVVNGQERKARDAYAYYDYAPQEPVAAATPTWRRLVGKRG